MIRLQRLEVSEREAIGGTAGPLLFGYLIVSGALATVAGGYAVAAVLMLLAAGPSSDSGLMRNGGRLKASRSRFRRLIVPLRGRVVEQGTIAEVSHYL
jgi:hypothetical protein